MEVKDGETSLKKGRNGASFHESIQDHVTKVKVKR